MQSGGCRFESPWGFGFFLKGAHYEGDYSGKKTYLAGLQCTLTSSCAKIKEDPFKEKKSKKVHSDEENPFTSRGRLIKRVSNFSAQTVQKGGETLQ